MGGQFSAYSLVRSSIIFPYDWNNMSKRPANHCFIPKNKSHSKRAKKPAVFKSYLPLGCRAPFQGDFDVSFSEVPGMGGQSPDRNHQRNHSIGLHQSPPTIDSYSFPSWLLPRNGLVQFPFIQDSAPMDLPWKWWWNQVVPSNWNLGILPLKRRHSSTPQRMFPPAFMEAKSGLWKCHRQFKSVLGDGANARESMYDIPPFWEVSRLNVCLSAYPAYAAPPGATNRCFRHEAKGFQLATKSISTRNQKSNFKKFCSLSLSPICTSCETCVTRRTARRLRCLRCFGFRVHQRCICLKALLIPPRQANGITTWSKNQSFGLYPNTCLMFSVHFTSLWWKFVQLAHLPWNFAQIKWWKVGN